MNTLAILVFALFVQKTTDAPLLYWVKEVRPGVLYRQEVRLHPPLIIHSLKFRYPSENLYLEPVLSGNSVLPMDGSPHSRETVSSLARRLSASCALNADYFAPNGDPIGLFILKGEILSEPFPQRAVVAWGKSPLLFDEPEWDARIVLPDSSTIKIDGINRVAKPHEIIVATPTGGLATAQVPSYHFVLRSEQPLKASGETPAEFRYIVSEAKTVRVEEQHLILVAGPEKYKALIPYARERSQWKISISIKGALNYAAIEYAVGGGPRLLKEGKIVQDYAKERFAPSLYAQRHPRTAVGVTPNSDVIWVVVEGRWSRSQGVTLPELAEIMKRLGCVDAINLDGGGSSVLFAGDLLLNRPSEGTERPVANALLLYAPPWPPPEKTYLIVPKNDLIQSGEVVLLTVQDEQGNKLDNSSVIWSCVGNSAWIDQGGRLHALSEGIVLVRAAIQGTVVTTELQILPRKSFSQSLNHAHDLASVTPSL